MILLKQALLEGVNFVVHLSREATYLFFELLVYFKQLGHFLLVLLLGVLEFLLILYKQLLFLLLLCREARNLGFE